MSTSETITRNDLANILNEVIPTTSVNYVVETHIEPLTIATNAYVETTFTATKSGYFPLGIVGYRIGWVSGETGKCNIYSVEMTDKSEGSVTVAYAVYNTTSASVSMNLRVDILWAKVDGASASFQADYIVEQGTDGIWTYRKWNSGIAEAWMRTGSYSYVMTNTVSGNGYVSDYWTLPSGLFTSVTEAHVNRINGGNGLVSCSIYSMTTSRIDHYIWITGTTATITMELSVEVKGRWK